MNFCRNQNVLPHTRSSPKRTEPVNVAAAKPAKLLTTGCQSEMKPTVNPVPTASGMQPVKMIASAS